MQREGGIASMSDRVQMRKREMSPCRVPCHLGQMGLADVVVVGAGDVAVEAGAVVAGTEVVTEEPGLSLGGMSQTWHWAEG